MTVIEHHWRDDAACMGMDPELFFPGRGDNRSVKAAKAVCRTCPVATQCLDHALETREQFGIWGGASERERKRMRNTPRRTGFTVIHGGAA